MPTAGYCGGRCACRTSAITPARSTSPAPRTAEPTEVLGEFLRDVMRRTMNNFRVFGPDETASNRCRRFTKPARRHGLQPILPEDADGTEIAPDGPRDGDAQRAHTGRLDGGIPAHWAPRLLLHATKRSSTSSIRCSTSTPSGWRNRRRSCAGGPPFRSLNLLITSVVWRQDHNGFYPSGSRLP